jgi:hypothetical protein
LPDPVVERPTDASAGLAHLGGDPVEIAEPDLRFMKEVGESLYAAALVFSDK